MRQEGAGRPVRFFGLFLALWVGARLASLSGHGIPPDRVIAAAAPVPPALAIAIPETLPRPSRATFFVWKQPPFLRSRQFAPLLLPSSTQVSPAAAQDAGLPLDLMNFIVFSVAFANRHHASDMDISIAPLATPPPQPPRPHRQGATRPMGRKRMAAAARRKSLHAWRHRRRPAGRIAGRHPDRLWSRSFGRPSPHRLCARRQRARQPRRTGRRRRPLAATRSRASDPLRPGTPHRPGQGRA